MPLLSDMETLLYDASRVFLGPVWLLIIAALAYALIMLGAFVVESFQRRLGSSPRALRRYCERCCEQSTEQNAAMVWVASDDLEIWIMHKLEWLRIVSRTAPMLGLIATMIPMGPALLALGANDAAAVGANIVAAFSAVILALLAASICYFILTVRRRWLLQELRDLERERAREGV